MDFYPSMVAHLTLRFDEALQVAREPDRFGTKAKRTDVDFRVGQDRSRPQEPRTVTTDQEAEKAFGDPNDLKNIPPNSVGLEPLVLPDDGNLTQIENRLPKVANVELPGHRQAGVFSMTLSYRDLPIDPRLIRAALVEIHLGTVAASDYSDGQTVVNPEGAQPSILKTRVSGSVPNDKTILGYFLVDNWAVDHSEKGSWVRLKGRDVRSIFIDTKVPMKSVSQVDITQPIDQVISDIIQTMPLDDDISIDVVIDEGEWDGTVPSPADEEGLTKLRRAGGGGKVSTTSDRPSYWDLITKYSFLVGAVPVFTGRRLEIRRSRRLFETLLDPTIPTPFANGKPRFPGNDESGEDAIRVRRIVYGQNVEKLSYERKFTGANVPIVEVVSLDDTKRGLAKLLIKQWPPAGSREAKIKGDNEKIRIPVAGVRDEARLEAIAEDVYEEIGRGEMGGMAATKDMTSFGGNNNDPDMLRIRPGDPVEIVVDTRALRSQAPLVSDLTDHERRSFAEEVRFLEERLSNRTLARAIVATNRSAIIDLLRYFRVSNVKYDMNVERGVRVAFDFQNYIIPRHKVSSVYEAQQAEKKTKVTKRGPKKKAQFKSWLADESKRSAKENWTKSTSGRKPLDPHTIDFYATGLMSAVPDLTLPQARKIIRDEYYRQSYSQGNRAK